MSMTKLILSVAPRVVFDLRDWYQSTFTAALVPTPGAAAGTIPAKRSVIRPLGTVRFFAEPTNPPHADWPFRGMVQLVTSVSAQGMHAFHGRVRIGENAAATVGLRQLNVRTQCKLTIQAAGFKPEVLETFVLPGAGEPVLLPEPIDLFPAADYAFPQLARQPATVVGAVRQIDGSGLAGVKIQVPDPRPGATSGSLLFETVTTDDGRYCVVLDELLKHNGTTEVPQAVLEFAHANWRTPPLERTVKFVPVPQPLDTSDPIQHLIPSRHTFAATRIRGQVFFGGIPAADATVSINGPVRPSEPGESSTLAGEVRTNAHGEWQFHGDARLPLSGTCAASIQATVIVDQKPVASSPVNVPINLGTSNDCPLISFKT